MNSPERIGQLLSLNGVKLLAPTKCLYAAPTTGKTTLVQKFPNVLDTDVIFHDHFPWYFERRFWLADDTTSKLIREQIYVFIATIIRLEQPSFVVTNLAGAPFWRLLTGRKGPSLAIGRATVRVTEELITQRKSTPVPHHILKRWIESSHHIVRSSEHGVLLPDDQFLLDRVELTPNGFLLKQGNE